MFWKIVMWIFGSIALLGVISIIIHVMRSRTTTSTAPASGGGGTIWRWICFGLMFYILSGLIMGWCDKPQSRVSQGRIGDCTKHSMTEESVSAPVGTGKPKEPWSAQIETRGVAAVCSAGPARVRTSDGRILDIETNDMRDVGIGATATVEFQSRGSAPVIVRVQK